MIIPVPEWENEVAWPGGNLAHSVFERLGAEYDWLVTGLQLSPPQLLWPNTKQGKRPCAPFLLESW